MSRETAAFLHIHKAAGTTLNQIITRQYSPGTLVDLYGEPERLEAFKRLPDQRKRRFQMVRGHFGFGIHEFLPQPLTYFTLLRDPVEQTISQYYFLKSTLEQRRRMGYADDETYRKISTMTLDDFIRDAVPERYDNPQTRAIAGTRGNIFDDTVTESVLESATGNLARAFSVVGIVEDFERSLLLLKRRYSWSNVYFVPKNQTRDRPARAAIEPALVERIRATNQFDARLYGFAKQRLAGDDAGEGARLDDEVRAFRAANASVGGRAGFAASTAISKLQRWLYEGITLGRSDPLT